MRNNDGTAKMTIEEYQKRILREKTPDRLNIVLSDLGAIKLPIFYGETTLTGRDFCTIKNVHRLLDGKLVDCPYESKQEFWVIVNGIGTQNGYNDDLKVFFTIGIDKPEKNTRFIVAKRVMKFSGIFGEKEIPEDISNLVLSDISNLFKLICKFSEDSFSLNSIIAEVNSASDRIESIQSYINRQQRDIEEISSIKKSLVSPDEMQKLYGQAQKVDKTINDWKAISIPDEKDIERRIKLWKSLGNELEDIQKKYLSSLPIVKEKLPNSQEKISLRSYNRIKARMKYNYDSWKIRMFLSALNTLQIIALCGKPGGGKTTFAEQMANAIGARFHLIEVQNNWTDRSDLLGFYNPTEHNYQSTEFLEAIFEARKEEAELGEAAPLHIICLDEMNLSRIEYYFATFLSLLQRDRDKQIISLLPPDINDEKLQRYMKFKVPKNVRFIGTMNMDDTAQFLSPKVIDRSIFIEFNDKIAPAKNNNIQPVDSYFPASQFSTPADEVLELKEQLGEIPHISSRTIAYMELMWSIYKKLDTTESKNNSFIDLIILTKILPALTRKPKIWGDDGKAISAYSKSLERYLQGVESGQQAHHYDSSTWSYWELYEQ